LTAAPGAIARQDITFGLLAGGRATRLGGRDKAWLTRDGVPQVVRLARCFSPVVSGVLVSANRDLARHAAAGLQAVADRVPDAGPLGGLDALAQACATPWLFTVPVDLVEAEPGLLDALVRGASEQGACACDEDGPQPLLALWPAAALREAVGPALDEGRLSVQALQRQLDMPVVRFQGVRLGNLNTPAALRAAGMETDPA